jgi:hypothetical protein
MATTKYQTLEDFLRSPFHKTQVHHAKNKEYDDKYNKFLIDNKIVVAGMTVVENSYFIHIKIPSESRSKDGQEYSYDVIIRFFTTDPEVMNEKHLRNYHIQFFSNSPSFMYQYAYLYNKEGFLIQALYSKLDADYIDKAPEKTNAEMKLSYDKSIYFACKFLCESKFKYLQKHGVITIKKKPSSKFFRDISDFKSVKFDSYLLAEEKKLTKELDKHNSFAKKMHEKEKERNAGKKTATKNTSQVSSVNKVQKKTGKPKVTSGTKKTATRSTRPRRNG